MNSNRIIRFFLLIIVIGAIGLLVYNKVKKDHAEELASKEAKAGSGNLLVDAYVIKGTPLQNSLDAPGTLLSSESINLQPETTGRITQILFKEGSHVHKGDLLVELFNNDLQAQLEKTKIQQQLAEITLQREEKLLAINGISVQEVDDTKNEIAADQADLDYYNAEISKTEIKAPFNGVVGLKSVSVGAIVSPTTVIADFEQTDPIKIQFAVPEKYLDKIKEGDHITFTITAFPERIFDGRIYAIDPAIDPTSRMIQMRAIANNPDGLLKPGAFANIHIELRKIPDAIMIPSQALIPTTRDNQVVIIKNNKAEYVDVQTGIENQNNVQITRGLQIGDTVVTAGFMQAKPGMPLQVLHFQNN
jgi:membrane fusion protein, multidrug efflux system